MHYLGNTPVFDDLTPSGVTHDVRYTRGCVPRDTTVDPPAMRAAEVPTFQLDEIRARLKDQKATKGLNSDLRLTANDGKPIPSLDQGQVGYCWAHSTTHAVMGTRARASQPYIPLSAYSIAATIKQGRDEGGWCGLSLKRAIEVGITPQSLWAQGDRNYQRHNTPAELLETSKFKVDENSYDVSLPVYGQTLQLLAIHSLLVTGRFVAGDFNWWGHSVCLLDTVDGVQAFNDSLLRMDTGKLLTAQEFDERWNTQVTGGFGLNIWNSWADTWGNLGMGVLSGSRAIPDNACAPLTALAG